METAATTASRAPEKSERGAPTNRQPGSFGRHIMDPAHGRAMAGFARTISKPFDLLAAVAALGGPGRLA